MRRHLPTFDRRLTTAHGSVQINTSAWRATAEPVWLRIGPQLNSFTTEEARAIGRALIEATDHADAARQSVQEAPACTP